MRHTGNIPGESQPDGILITITDLVSGCGWGRGQGRVQRKCMFSSCLVYIIDVLYGYRSIWLLWKNTHRGYYHLIIHQGCCQVSLHIVQQLEKYLDMDCALNMLTLVRLLL